MAENTLTHNSKLTRDELAEHYNVSTRCIGNWQRAGIIPFHRIGRVVRFDLQEVNEALEDYKVQVFASGGKKAS